MVVYSQSGTCASAGFQLGTRPFSDAVEKLPQVRFTPSQSNTCVAIAVETVGISFVFCFINSSVKVEVESGVLELWGGPKRQKKRKTVGCNEKSWKDGQQCYKVTTASGGASVWGRWTWIPGPAVGFVGFGHEGGLSEQYRRSMYVQTTEDIEKAALLGFAYSIAFSASHDVVIRLAVHTVHGDASTQGRFFDSS